MYNGAIIGCGRMGSLFEEDPLTKDVCTHAGALSAFEKTNIVAACDLRKDRLNRFGKSWNVQNLYTDYRELLQTEKIDILSIATPTESHKEICIAAAESGVKAIFCEKPMACSIGDCEEMIQACASNRVLLVINHTRRWDNSFQLIKTLIEEGEIGKPTTINAYSTVGFMNGGTHLFDLLRLYFGEIEELQGWIHPDESSDPGGRAIITFKNGSVCFLDAIWRDYVFFGLDIFGEKGLIKTSGMIRSSRGFEMMKAMPSTNESGIFELISMDFDTPEWKPPMLAAMGNIVNALENKEEPRCSGHDGMAAVEMAVAIHDSEKRGNTPVKFAIDNKALSIYPRETSFTKDGKLKKEQWTN